MKLQVSYTFDAGPNAFLFIQQKDTSLFMSALIEVFPSEQPIFSYLRGIVSTQTDVVSEPTRYNNITFTYINYTCIYFQIKQPHRFKSKEKNCLKYIMVTKLGSGPRCTDDHLLNNDGTLKLK